MVVVAADTAARAQGLQPRTPLAQATAMVPGLAVAEADPEGDRQALRDLAAWCLHLSPMTAPDPPDGIWIDVTGCAHLHGGEAPMLDALVAQLSTAGLAARAGLADTPGAAHAVARHGGGRVAAVVPGGHADALWPMPLCALRLFGPSLDGLHRLGVERVGQLAALPRGPLARRFGGHVLLRLDQALGRSAEPIQPVLPPETVHVRHAFLEPVSTAEAFSAAILVLVEAACAALERRGLGVRRLDLVFERVDGGVQVVRVGTARPVRDVGHLARLLGERIGTVDPGFGVEAMRLVLPLVEPLGPVQYRDALDGTPDGSADIAALVDRLGNRLGANRVYRVAPVESDVPERAMTLTQPLASAGGPRWAAPWPRPARLLLRPEPVEAMGMLPDHPPRAFTWRRVRHRVARSDGPERIVGEWWRRAGERAAVRDYWAVEDEGGQRFWLFRQGDGLDPATGGLAWFLHGLF
jgi:protein ImuB